MLPQQMKDISPEELALDSAPAIVSTFGPNLMAAVTSMTLSEIRRFLGYSLSDVIGKNATGEIAEIYRKVQRKLQHERATRFAEYIERTILEPRSLDHPDQGYLPAITIITNRPLKIGALPMATSGGRAQAMISRDEQTVPIISDGAARIGGIELEEKKLSRATSGPREIKLRHELEKLRIPVLILAPQHGTLGEEHMAQALFDQNVLATPLPAGTAMTHDMRSSYNTIMRKMASEGLNRFGIGDKKNYPQNGDPDYVFVMPRLLRFVRVAVEGRKAAESAKGVPLSALDEQDIAQLSHSLTKFWLRIIDRANANDSGIRGRGFTQADAKDNIALTMAGMAALGVIANELFKVRTHTSEEARNQVIDTVAAIPWERTNKLWAELVTPKFDQKTGERKLTLNTAGGSAVRAITKILRTQAFGISGENAEATAA